MSKKNKKDEDKKPTKDSIEKDLVKEMEWEQLELEELARKMAKDKFLLIQQSSYMGEICRRIMAGQDIKDLAMYLMSVAEHEFAGKTASWLAETLERFKTELYKEVYRLGENEKVATLPVNRIDYEVMNMRHKPLIVSAMWERLIHLQESRVVRALSEEDKMSQKSGERVTSEIVQVEMDRYARYLDKLGTYKKTIGMEDNESALQEFTHNFTQMGKVYELMAPTDRVKFREHLEKLARNKAMIEQHNKPPEIPTETVEEKLGRELTPEEVAFIESKQEIDEDE